MIRITTAPALLAALLLTACGTKSDPAPAPTAAPSASASAVPLPEPPASPFSVALEAKSPLVLFGLEGGVVIADVAHTRLARASGQGAALAVSPMPAGLPAGPGRVLRAAGRLPSALWLVFEKQGDTGKAESTPLFRLTKDEWKQFADDWKPAISAWSKNRILAASTSSGHLKLKVIEPSSPKPPEDLPSTRLNDESCAKSLVVHDLAAVRTGEVFAAGNCRPDSGAGAGKSPLRYVVVRWSAGARPADAPDAGNPIADAGPSDAGSAAPDAGDAGSSAGESPAHADERPGIVDVIPGVSENLRHQALFAESGSSAYAVAVETGKAGTQARLFHFDGATWGVEALPPAMALLRSIVATADGTLWAAAEHGIWQRPPGAAWQSVPPPERAFPRGDATWELFDAWVVGGADVWISARRTGPSGRRDVVLRLGDAKSVLWD